MKAGIRELATPVTGPEETVELRIEGDRVTTGEVGRGGEQGGSRPFEGGTRLGPAHGEAGLATLVLPVGPTGREALRVRRGPRLGDLDRLGGIALVAGVVRIVQLVEPRSEVLDRRETQRRDLRRHIRPPIG